MASTVYLVRHGLTSGNVANTLQDGSDMLTEQGIAQAKRLADRFTSVPFERLISSEFKRAVDTAEEIAKVTGKPAVTSPLFIEVSAPKELEHVRRDDPKVLAYVEAFNATDDGDWKQGGEESFNETKERARRALEHLAALPEKNVVVVTHGHFIRSLLASMIFGEALTKREWVVAAKFFMTVNTGITVARFDAGAWRLLTWNDHAHLADER